MTMHVAGFEESRDVFRTCNMCNPWPKGHTSCLKVAHGAGVLWVLAVLTAGYVAGFAETVQAQTTEYSPEYIAEGMLAVEAQFANLWMRYTMSIPSVDEQAQVNKVTRLDVTYARKAEGEKEFIEWHKVNVDPRSDRQVEVAHRRITFNGNATTSLRFALDGDDTDSQHHKAMVFPGKEDKAYPNAQNLATNMIWRGFNGKVRYATILKNPEYRFRIDASERVHDVPAVKLVGTTPEGKLSIELWVSPTRSFLPLRMRLVRRRDNWTIVDRTLSDLETLNNDMWYPRTIKSHYPDLPDEASEIISIKEVSVDPLMDELFSPEFPVPTTVNDFVMNTHYFIGSVDTESLDDVRPDSSMAERKLKRFVRMAEEQVEEKYENETPVLEDRNRGSSGSRGDDVLVSRWLIVLLLAMVMAVIIAVLMLRKAYVTRKHREGLFL